jgi:hypothetical protein
MAIFKRFILTISIFLLFVGYSIAQIPGIYALPDTIRMPQMSTDLIVADFNLPYTYVWKYNGTFISSSNYIYYEKAGVYTVNVLSATQIIHRDTTVVLNSAVLYDRKDTVYVCEGDSVVLSYPPNKNIYWIVFFPDLTSNSFQNDSTITLSREAEINSLISLGPGGYSTDCFVVVFAPKDPVFLGDDSEFCTSRLLDAGDGIAHLWSTGETSRTINYTGPTGDVWVRVVNDYSCVLWDTIHLTNVETPSSDFIVNELGNGRIRFTQTNQNSDVNYYWDFGDGRIGIGSTIEHQYFTSSVNYLVSCQAIQKTAHCSSTSSQNISVLLSSTESNKKINIDIHPNPTSNYIKILGLSETDDNTAILYNAQGKVIMNFEAENNVPVDVSSLDNGVYFLKVGQVVKRVVKMFL